MKKLTVLVVIMLVAGLLAGCGIIPESKLWKIEVEPSEVWLRSPGESKQLEVTAYYDDGTVADVTLECDYTVNKPEALTQVVATVSAEGLITGIKTGWAIILVSYTQCNFWTSNITRTAEVVVEVN